MTPTDLIPSTIQTLAGEAAVLLVSALARWTLGKYLRSASAGYLRVGVPAAIAAGAALLYWRLGLLRPEMFGLLATLIVLGFALWELSRFWRVGLQGADPSISRGLDYGKALDLCQNEMWLLGTGAAKLSGHPKFEPAVRRCSRIEEDTPRVRFLLARPGSVFLGSAARQAGKPDHAYQERVSDSLRTLARLRKDGVNLEVRFYREETFLPLFRLMFIDNRLCLASYNVFGHGDGSELPQVRVSRDDVRDFASFYDPFRRYFAALWEDAAVWDPGEFLPK